MFQLIIGHRDCLDGHSCISIVKNKDENISFIYTIEPNTEIMKYLYYLKWIIYFASFIFNIKIYILDVLPIDIVKFIHFCNKNVYFEIHEHHKSNNNLINEIKLLNLTNVEINYYPELPFGATLSLVKKYSNCLDLDQINFYTKIAACDMWNDTEFPDFIYFVFGIHSLCNIKNIKMLNYDTIWYLSFYNNEIINYLTSSGKKWYSRIEKKIKNIPKNIIKYNDYIILLINTSILNIDKSVSSNNITTCISWFIKNNIEEFQDINTIAIYNENENNNSMSLRRNINSINNDIDVSVLAQICNGGGHRNAAGCNKKKFFEIIFN
jgi:hypothetical protein